MNALMKNLTRKIIIYLMLNELKNELFERSAGTFYQLVGLLPDS